MQSSMNSGTQLSSNKTIIGIYDQDDQIVNTDSSSQISVYLQNTSFSLLNSIKFIADQGKYDLNGLTLKGFPSSSTAIYAQSNAIDKTKYKTITNKDIEDLQLNILLQQCEIGFVLSDNICQICQKGYYSFEAASLSCELCPENAFCPNGWNITVDVGYWRANTTSSSIYSCLDPASCMGGFESTCSLGYKGTLCHECIGNQTEGFYARYGQNKCALCQNFSREMMKFFGVFLGICIYIAFMVSVVIRGAKRENNFTVCIRIITNYLQVVNTVLGLSLKWPDEINNFLNNFSVVGSMSEETNKEALSKGILALSPVLFGIFAFIFWLILRILKPNIFAKTYIRNTIATILTYIFLVYSSINEAAFSLLNCINIDGVNYLKLDFGVTCWTQDHYKLIFMLFLPIMAVWIVGFPLFFFFILRRNRKNLDDKNLIIKYGTFYIGLTDQVFYWEIIITNLKKIFLAVTLSTLSTSKDMYRALTACLIIIINFRLCIYLKPYSSPIMNRLEVYSQYAGCSTIIFGMFFIEPNTEKNQSAKLAIFFFVIFINILFLLIWFWNILKILIERVKLMKLQSGPLSNKPNRGITFTMKEQNESIISQEKPKLNIERDEDIIEQMKNTSRNNQLSNRSQHNQNVESSRKLIDMEAKCTKTYKSNMELKVEDETIENTKKKSHKRIKKPKAYKEHHK